MIRLALAACLLATTASAQPQQQCDKREKIVAKLSAAPISETQRTEGLRQEGVTASIFETWANDETGTWTIIVTKPDGMSCIMAYGAYWNDDGPLTPPGEPA